MKFLIIDSHALLHRSFHALPPLTTKKGEATGAIYGFLLTLFKAIKEIEPEYVVASFDAPSPTFRHKKFKEYKAKRKKPPEEFYKQIPKAKEILFALGIPIFEKEGFEADDLIATVAKKIPPEAEAYILTGDLDTLQLVNERIKVYTFKKGIKETTLYDLKKIVERFGVPPEKLVDLKALAGDPSDNIPGVPGIGKKTASLLIKKFGNLENLYREAERSTLHGPEPSAKSGLVQGQEIESGKERGLRPKIKETLLEHKEQAFFSRVLVKAREDVPIGFNIKECQLGRFDQKKVEQVLKAFEFYSLIKRLPALSLEGRPKEKKDNERRLF